MAATNSPDGLQVLCGQEEGGEDIREVTCTVVYCAHLHSPTTVSLVSVL